ncbi:MAG: methionyl-tRNA formyltransferase [Pseudohongiellaceae bacterium]|jgi:methionyl-tRNA formyltransferase
MKIAYFGYNAFSSCLKLLINQDHELACVFTGEDSVYADRIINCSTDHHIPLHFGKPNQAQMNALIAEGVELFLSAEYPWKIPVPLGLKFAINIHPTLLPDGRGPTPIPTLLLTHPQYAGVTFHKMTNELDGGDILLQKKISVDKSESYDTLSAKLYLETALLLNKLLFDLDHYYQNSQRQQKGSNWPMLSHDDQTINWNEPTQTLLKQFRAFGSLGVYAALQNQLYLITAGEGVIYEHNLKPGSIISSGALTVVIATNDGLISIPKNCLTSLSNLNK